MCVCVCLCVQKGSVCLLIALHNLRSKLTANRFSLARIWRLVSSSLRALSTSGTPKVSARAGKSDNRPLALKETGKSPKKIFRLPRKKKKKISTTQQFSEEFLSTSVPNRYSESSQSLRIQHTASTRDLAPWFMSTPRASNSFSTRTYSA